MISSRKDLFNKLFNELQQEGLLAEENYSDETILKKDFINICDYVFQDYHILDLLHEIK